MPDEIQQPATADAESSGVLTPEPATTEAPVQQADSVSADMPPGHGSPRKLSQTPFLSKMIIQFLLR